MNQETLDSSVGKLGGKSSAKRVDASSPKEMDDLLRALKAEHDVDGAIEAIDRSISLLSDLSREYPAIYPPDLSRAVQTVMAEDFDDLLRKYGQHPFGER